MPDGHTLWIFAIASAGLVLLPGPAMLYIVTRGVVHGRRGGIYSMLGVETGDFLQVLAATAGLAAIVASSAAAFTVVKYAGAAYLIYLGVARPASRAGEAAPDRDRAVGRPPLLGGLPGRRAEPEARPLPARVPAAVRRSRSRARLAADARPRLVLQLVIIGR